MNGLMGAEGCANQRFVRRGKCHVVAMRKRPTSGHQMALLKSDGFELPDAADVFEVAHQFAGEQVHGNYLCVDRFEMQGTHGGTFQSVEKA